MTRRYFVLWILALMLPAGNLWAGPADVTDVRVRKSSTNAYTFSVTVQHADAGWDHYADQWQVLGPDGSVLATRVLMHPHVEEQPFTRSLSGVKVPDGIVRVTIRAHDKVHGWGGKTVTIDLP